MEICCLRESFLIKSEPAEVCLVLMLLYVLGIVISLTSVQKLDKSASINFTEIMHDNQIVNRVRLLHLHLISHFNNFHDS